jgi:hypothetical protein
MNEYIVNEKALNEVESLLHDLATFLKKGMGMLTAYELQQGTLIAMGLLTWINTVKRNNLIKSEGVL